jgi:antitoxin HigA-1
MHYPARTAGRRIKRTRHERRRASRKLHVPTNRIAGILNGPWSIFFGTSAEFWLNLQSLYELRIARQKAGESIKALPRSKQSERVPA